ncbi:histidine kinase [Opitutus terrae PB90-1]|uniref:histidine kinase n=2 Tax=Opitutus terrae TaxID=107709 RepID=B1ZPM7_OPITP|nr:histidine kinase [Opitutus terrae PB90-1]
MHEIEITEIPPLKPAEQTLLDMHSVLNVFNVLWSELTLIGLALADDPAHLREGQALIGRLVAGLRDPVASLEAARHIESHIAHVAAEIAESLAARPGAGRRPEVARSLASLESVFAVLRVRAREVLARAGRPELWLDMTVAELLSDFYEVLAAMQTGSHGRFGIVYNAAVQGPNDYYVDLRFESAVDDRLRLPLVFKDAMRDLVANARKYTAPGGQITAALFADHDRLRLAVRDTGRGIPMAELASVIDYGRRGSNVSDVRTMGGGFGLTKAFFVTKQFGGRFWIASELGHGTRVRIEIPLTPPAAAAS